MESNIVIFLGLDSTNIPIFLGREFCQNILVATISIVIHLSRFLNRSFVFKILLFIYCSNVYLDGRVMFISRRHAQSNLHSICISLELFELSFHINNNYMKPYFLYIWMMFLTHWKRVSFSALQTISTALNIMCL